MTPTSSQPKIHIERMMYRNSIAVAGDSAASYALVKLIPTGGGAKPLPLNLALVLDVSGSMYEEDGTGKSRLSRVQEAAFHALQKLKPEDSLAIVAFAYDCQVVLPSTPLTQKAAIEDVIQRIDRFEVDPGGTAMDAGITAGLAEVEKNLGPGKLSQIIVLTDGETSNETTCRDLARKAAEKKIYLNVIGVGTEWNQTLIKDLAKLAEGDWGYIDVNDANAAERVFGEQFGSLSAVGFLNVEMRLKAMKDIRIKRVRQVVPDIKELPLVEPEERLLVASLGTLERDRSPRYILDLSLPKRPDGKFVIAQVEVTYDTGRGRESTGMVPLEVSYTAAGQGYINAEVAKHIDEVQIFEQNKLLQKAIASGDKAEVERVAKNIADKGEVMGPRAAKKTMLARQVLQELNVGGRVSKKTQLAVDDVARMVEDAPSM
ncbi:MAG: VWA domain-containing protein [Gemmataceae bacterium]